MLYWASWMALSKTLDRRLMAPEDEVERDVYMSHWIFIGEKWLSSEAPAVKPRRDSDTPSHEVNAVDSDEYRDWAQETR